MTIRKSSNILEMKIPLSIDIIKHTIIIVVLSFCSNLWAAQPMKLVPGEYRVVVSVVTGVRNAGLAAKGVDTIKKANEIRIPEVCLDYNASTPDESDTYSSVDGKVFLIRYNNGKEISRMLLSSAIDRKLAVMVGTGNFTQMAVQVPNAKADDEYVVKVEGDVIAAHDEKHLQDTRKAYSAEKQQMVVALVNAMSIAQKALKSENKLLFSMLQLELQELVWKIQLKQITTPEQLKGERETMVQNLLSDPVAILILHGATMSESDCRQLDSEFGSNLVAMELWEKSEALENSLKNPAILLEFPNLERSSKRLHDSWFGPLLKKEHAEKIRQSAIDASIFLPTGKNSDNTIKKFIETIFEHKAYASLGIVAPLASELNQQLDNSQFMISTTNPIEKPVRGADLRVNVNNALCLRWANDPQTARGLMSMLDVSENSLYEVALESGGVAERLVFPMRLDLAGKQPIATDIVQYVPSSFIFLAAGAIDMPSLLQAHPMMSRKLQESKNDPEMAEFIDEIVRFRGTLFVSAGFDPAMLMNPQKESECPPVCLGIARNAASNALFQKLFKLKNISFENNQGVMKEGGNSIKLSCNDSYWIVSCNLPETIGETKHWSDSVERTEQVAKLSNEASAFAMLDMKSFMTTEVKNLLTLSLAMLFTNDNSAEMKKTIDRLTQADPLSLRVLVRKNGVEITGKSPVGWLPMLFLAAQDR